jgi:hypothetical protein
MSATGATGATGATIIGIMKPVFGWSSPNHTALRDVIFGISFGTQEDAEHAKQFIEDLMRNFAYDDDMHDPDFKDLERREEILSSAISAFKREHEIDEIDEINEINEIGNNEMCVVDLSVVAMDTTPDEVDHSAPLTPRKLKKERLADPFESLFEAVRFALIGDETHNRSRDYMLIHVTKIEPTSYAIFGIITPKAKANANSWTYFDYSFSTAEAMMASLDLLHNLFDLTDELEFYSEADISRMMRLLSNFEFSQGVPPEDEIDKVRTSLCDIRQHAENGWTVEKNLSKLKEIMKIVQGISLTEIVKIEEFLKNPNKDTNPDKRVISDIIRSIKQCIFGPYKLWSKTHERFRHIRSIGPYDGFVYAIL